MEEVKLLCWRRVEDVFKTSKCLLGTLKAAKINHEEYTIITNQAEKYHKLKDSIRMMEIERKNIAGNKRIENGKKMAVDNIIKK